ncbi:hypothetical protein I4U23_012912 [Adineta vaga]|nr:hypothetical protein I4U23_012912 [Adineta vaga]
MALKTELYDKLRSIGYQLGPFASKDTLSVVLCLHSVVMAEENINVAKLDDLDLRRQLTQHGLRIGPVTNHTRAIYQRKLLEVLTKQSTEGKEDPLEIDEPVLQTKSEKNTLYPNLFDTKPSSPIKPSIYSKKDEPSILRNNYKPAKDYTNNRNTFE